MYIVCPTNVSILGVGGSCRDIWALDSQKGNHPTMIYFGKNSDLSFLSLLGVDRSPCIIPLENLTPTIKVSAAEFSGTLTFSGRIAPNGGYYFTDDKITLLARSVMGFCVYKSAPTRLPYRFAYKGKSYGDKYYRGENLPQCYSDYPGDTRQWEGEWDSSLKCTLTATQYGWWEKEDKDEALFGKYKGRGEYLGKSMIVGFATWVTPHNHKIQRLERESPDEVIQYGDWIYDNETNMWWLGDKKPPTGPGNDPIIPGTKYQGFKQPILGENFNLTVITVLPDGTLETKEEIAEWEGYRMSEEEQSFTTYACEVPAWRE